MGKPIQYFHRHRLTGYSILLMWVSLLLPRAVLSISMMLFFALTIMHRHIGVQLRSYISTPFLFVFSLLFWIPFVSGLWSADVQQWSAVVITKLPFLLMPVAFAGRWQLKDVEWRWIAHTCIAVAIAGAVYSMAFYFSDMAGALTDYRQARLLPTVLGNDHVRFSWWCAVAVMCGFFLLEHHSKNGRSLLIAAIIFIILYLHVLAARMGLICLYIFLASWLLYNAARWKSKKWFPAGVLLLMAMPFAAWYALPSLQTRIQYMVYDLQNVRSGTYVTGTNDGARVYSIKAGWEILKNNPLGTGAGDLKHTVHDWYGAHMPGVADADRFPPLNEWLMYAGFAGWPGMGLFTLIVLWPLFIRNVRYRFYWIVLNVLIIFTHLFDAGLEVQYGVFLYSFILLWWYKWFKPE